ncbi:MAG: hypothetical protein CMK92_06455 [Pseudomonas sp.]|nr:hypothetical protein [Pseudomonas sp.]
MLKLLLMLILVGCSVSKDGESNNTSDQVTQDQNDSALSGDRQGASLINDKDGDYIPDELEGKFEYSNLVPNVPEFMIVTDYLKLSEGGEELYEFIYTDHNFLHDYVKLLSLGDGDTSDFDFIKRAEIYKVSKDKGNLIFEENNTCIEDCTLEISLKVAVDDSAFFRNFQNFEVAFKYYDTLTHSIYEIDNRVINDSMGKPISLNLGQVKSGMTFENARYEVPLSKEVYEGIFKGDFVLLIGLQNVAIKDGQNVITLFDIEQKVATNSQRVVLLHQNFIYEYSSPDQEYLKQKVFDQEMHRFDFNNEDIYSVDSVSNTMTSWPEILDINEYDYQDGLWKISNSGFSHNLIEKKSYFISYITNLDRLKLAPKRYIRNEYTAETFSHETLKPFESLSLRMSKQYELYREKIYDEDYETRVTKRGEKACFNYDSVFDDSCCNRGGGGDIRFLFSNDRQESYCCGNRTFCTDEDYTVGFDSYKCSVTKSSIEQYIDESKLRSLNDFIVYYNGMKVSHLSLFDSSQSLSGAPLISHTENDRTYDLRSIRISQPKSIKHLREGYIEDNCLKATCSQTNRFRSTCIERAPSRKRANTEKKVEKKNIRFEVVKKEIYERR